MFRRYNARLVAVVVAAAVMPRPARAQDARQAFRAEDIFALRFAMDPQISPDGKRVAYVRRDADVSNDRLYDTIWLVNADGTQNRAITSGRVHDAAPRWSPDGSRLAFISDRDSTGQIYVLRLSSGEITRVTDEKNGPGVPAWSPDGRQIAFTMTVPESPTPMVNLPMPPAGASWSAPARVIDDIPFRRDAEGEIQPGFTHLYVVNADGGAVRQLSSTASHLGSARSLTGTPSWTPDGKRILIAANRNKDLVAHPFDSEVYTYDVRSGESTALTDRRGPDESPTPSPDGQWIAWVGFDDAVHDYQTTHLYVMRPDGREWRQLLVRLDRDVENPRWSGDSKRIYFQYDDHGVSRVAFVAVADDRVTRVADSVGSRNSAYGDGSYSVSNDGTVAFTQSSPTVAGEVAVARPSAVVARITTLNDSLFARRRLASFEEIWYQSSRDSTRVEGWIIRPPDFDPRRKYPLLLDIHGGPQANFGPRFSLEKEVWAGAGYIVFIPNVRGSTSYGEEFTALIQRAFPGDELYDLESGVDAVIARGYVDTTRLYIEGGSGGGTLTAWVIGHTNRYRAAVVMYPVINWTSFVLSTDDAYWPAYSFGGTPWTLTADYARRSVLSIVGQVRTPTMIMTGEEDWRTPMWESEQYFTALRLNGVEAVLVKVPDEPHGIRRRPSHHMQKIAYTQAWLDSHGGAKASP